jgi:hypothetical protein
MVELISKDCKELINKSRRLYEIVSGEKISNDEMNEKFKEFILDKSLYQHSEHEGKTSIGDEDLVPPYNLESM